ncbi:MAG: exo-alpha-sialidase [Acidobacteria bacterium]|nr:exo-alpha-sialidase [Acidobacteriota bacterium]
MNRRHLLSLGLAAAAGAQKNEVFELAVCPWTPEHPRHDHAQIFPLSGDRLMLIWCEYYLREPSRVFRNPYSEGGSGDQAACQISGKISRDRGRTWSGTFTVQENIGADNVKHCNLLRLASGEILLFFTVRDFKKHESQIWFKRSKDECETWTKPEPLTSEPGFWLTNADRALLHRSGRILLPGYWSPKIWAEGEHFIAFTFYSDDQGRTWKRSSKPMDLPKRGAEEPAVVELKDGSLLAVLRSSLGKIYAAKSRDRGETWSPPEATPLVAPASQPALKRIPGTDQLVVLYNNTYKPDESHGGVRNPLTSAISNDEGKTWRNIKNIEDRAGYDSAYPAMAFSGGEALITYYQRSRAMSRDTWLMLKIYPVDWFSRA